MTNTELNEAITAAFDRGEFPEALLAEVQFRVDCENAATEDDQKEDQ